MKVRVFEDRNYKAVYHDGITIRSAFNSSNPILPLDHPEFWDVKITNCCNADPLCSYCYMNSRFEEPLYPVLSVFEDFFARLSNNNRPFQIAFGGGEPTFHPQFTEILESCHRMGIVPNYTTNGIDITPKVLEATEKYCGGVAVSTHEQLDWESGVKTLTAKNSIFLLNCLLSYKVNLHSVINDRPTIDYFYSIYKKYENKPISYFVLLPYEKKGRAKHKNIDYDYLKQILSKCDLGRIAFGAHFYEFLRTEEPFNKIISLYEPEIFSKFLDLTTMKIYNNSFEV